MESSGGFFTHKSGMWAEKTWKLGSTETIDQSTCTRPLHSTWLAFLTTRRLGSERECPDSNQKLSFSREPERSYMTFSDLDLEVMQHHFHQTVWGWSESQLLGSLKRRVEEWQSHTAEKHGSNGWYYCGHIGKCKWAPLHLDFLLRRLIFIYLFEATVSS